MSSYPQSPPRAMLRQTPRPCSQGHSPQAVPHARLSHTSPRLPAELGSILRVLPEPRFGLPRTGLRKLLPALCSRETPFTQHEPLSSRQAGLLTSGPGNPRVSRAEAGRGLGPSSPARTARPLPHWHAGGTHRWNQSSLLRAELLSRELGAFISSVLGSRELGAERAHLGTQSLLLTAISRHSCR